MLEILHEITGISRHTNCYSKAIFDITDIGCTCKFDTVETKVVGTENYRTWTFPKGKVPFEVGQQVSEETLVIARTTGATMAYEDAKAKKSEKDVATANDPTL